MRFRRPLQGPAATAFTAAPRPEDSLGWRDAGWCAVDLEMTGLNPRTDEIVAIGTMPISEGRVVLGGGMYTLVRASKRSQEGAVLIHKLRLADVADAPSLEEGIDLVLEALAGRIPVFHTAAIETAFLGRQFGRRRVGLPAAADTEALGRTWLRHRDGGAAPKHGISLGRLAGALGQPAEAPHHALADALTTAQVFIALASLLDTVAPQTVGSLLRASASERPTAARRFGPG
ncbi:MAG TPA: exonuclease domain-containing protein [Solirubrobacteraceae bacterium]|nr:exonuclease domain-containing protein [Solirubrobacteraceae bacterium]